MSRCLASLRQMRRLATIVVMLYASTGVLAAAGACMPGPHRHQGVEAPDCVMHHHGASGHGSHASHTGAPQKDAAGDDGHHAGAGAHAAPQNHSRDAAITCACGDELRALHPADAALVMAAGNWSPSLVMSGAHADPEPRLPSFDPQSPSPPPRA